FGLEVRGVPAAETARRVEQAAERLGLTASLERRPAELSGGERQRVALGRAIVREPRVFLYDEPLSSLDPTLRGELRAELLELHHALGVTVVYVTHDQVEAMMMGQRIAVLDAGRLRQLGTPAEVYGQPAGVFVARFRGNPGMDVLQGRGRGTGRRGGVVDCGAWSSGVALALDGAGRARAGRSHRFGRRRGRAPGAAGDPLSRPPSRPRARAAVDRGAGRVPPRAAHVARRR